MRNPIQPSPSRPVPLPDSILLDAWWADLRADTDTGIDAAPALRLVAGDAERRRRRDARPELRPQGR